MSEPTWFAYISHRPYARAGGKSDELLAFFVNYLIHADGDIGSRQPRLRQLVSIAGFSKFSDTFPCKKPECFTESSLVACPLCCRHGPARDNLQVLELERVEVGFGNDASKCVASANEVHYHLVTVAGRRVRHNGITGRRLTPKALS